MGIVDSADVRGSIKFLPALSGRPIAGDHLGAFSVLPSFARWLINLSRRRSGLRGILISGTERTARPPLGGIDGLARDRASEIVFSRSERWR